MTKPTLIVAAVAAALAFTSASYGAMSKDERKAEQDRISSSYKAAKEKCDTLKGNQKDVCMAEAKGAQKTAKAELEAKDKGTAKAQADARIAKAEADYDVAKEKCDDMKGKEKDACVKDAKATLARAKADAKVATASTDKKTPERSRETRRDTK